MDGLPFPNPLSKQSMLMNIRLNNRIGLYIDEILASIALNPQCQISIRIAIPILPPKKCPPSLLRPPSGIPRSLNFRPLNGQLNGYISIESPIELALGWMARWTWCKIHVNFTETSGVCVGKYFDAFERIWMAERVDLHVGKVTSYAFAFEDCNWNVRNCKWWDVGGLQRSYR